MDYIWMTARSLTQAQKMVRTLESAAIGAVLLRARGAAAAKGCGYMVGIKKQQEEKARQTLRAVGIVPQRVFSGQEATGWGTEHDLF